MFCQSSLVRRVAQSIESSSFQNWMIKKILLLLFRNAQRTTNSLSPWFVVAVLQSYLGIFPPNEDPPTTSSRTIHSQRDIFNWSNNSLLSSNCHALLVSLLVTTSNLATTCKTYEADWHNKAMVLSEIGSLFLEYSKIWYEACFIAESSLILWRWTLFYLRLRSVCKIYPTFFPCSESFIHWISAVYFSTCNCNKNATSLKLMLKLVRLQ